METKKYKKYLFFVDKNLYPEVVELLERCPRATRSDLIIKGIKLLMESGLVPLSSLQPINNNTVSQSIEQKDQKKEQVIDLSNMFD